MRALLYILLAIAYLGCKRIEEPEFREIKTFRVKSLGLEEVTIGLGMSFYNPNNFTVSVKETAAGVYLDSVFLGDFRQDTIVPVGSSSEFTIPLSATIPVSTFFKLNLKDIHKREVLIQADGSTRVGKAGIFITKAIHYSGRHRLSEIKLQ